MHLLTPPEFENGHLAPLAFLPETDNISTSQSSSAELPHLCDFVGGARLQQAQQPLTGGLVQRPPHPERLQQERRPIPPQGPPRQPLCERLLLPHTQRCIPPPMSITPPGSRHLHEDVTKATQHQVCRSGAKAKKQWTPDSMRCDIRVRMPACDMHVAPY